MKFIVLEGPDGSGKTTLANSLVEYFNQNTSYQAKYVSPLDDETIGKPIKSLITQAKGAIDGYRQTEIALIVASMVGMLEKHGTDDENTILICDRWILSTYVYQAIAKEQPIQFIQQWVELVNKLRQPDLVLVLDLPDEKLDERMQKRGVDKNDKFEAKEFQARVRQGYRNYGVYHHVESAKTKVKTIQMEDDLQASHAKLLSEIIRTVF